MPQLTKEALDLSGREHDFSQSSGDEKAEPFYEVCSSHDGFTLRTAGGNVLTSHQDNERHIWSTLSQRKVRVKC